MDIVIGFLAVALIVYYFVHKKRTAAARDEKEGDRVIHTLYAYNSGKEHSACNRRQLEATYPTRRSQEHLANVQQVVGKHDRLQELFDGIFVYLKGELEKAASEEGIELGGRFDREFMYVLLYITTTLLFRCASRENPASASDRLSMTSLRELAEAEGEHFGTLVNEYQARFEHYRKIELLMTKDEFLSMRRLHPIDSACF
jgi:hypothetical protein